MAKEILINVESQEKRVAVVNDGRLEEFYIERPQDKTIVGNIYKGKIEAVIPSINGAFVDIGMIKKGFLYLTEIENAYEPVQNGNGPQTRKDVKKGQEVLVQVVKESFGTKGPRLSCEIGIAGRYLVCMPQSAQVGVSRRIESDDERKRLKQTLTELKLPKDIGFIVRTAAEGKQKKELLRDVHFLYKLWKRLEKPIKRNRAPSLIYEEYDLLLRVIRDSFTDDVARLLVDSKEEYYRIVRFMKAFMGHFARKVELYRNDDLFQAKDVERQISAMFDSKVYVKSKAYIIIEQTEGLVVIDVNSGGFRERIGQEDAAFKINCEVAVEIAHQIRLRDLGGIIVIDFIDMEREGHRREVYNVLKKALATDRAKYDIAGISKFGLVEMTRERIHNTVATMTNQLCPYCSGKGKVKSTVTMSVHAMKEIKRYAKTHQNAQIGVLLNPMVFDELNKNQDELRFIERKFRVKINLMSNPTLHIEDVKVG
jgi:ribonuclease G